MPFLYKKNFWDVPHMEMGTIEWDWTFMNERTNTQFIHFLLCIVLHAGDITYTVLIQLNCIGI